MIFADALLMQETNSRPHPTDIPPRTSEQVSLERAPTDFCLSIKGECESRLRLMLKDIQSRLGTSAESLNDFRHAEAVAHQIRNLQSARRMEEGLRELDALEGF